MEAVLASADRPGSLPCSDLGNRVVHTRHEDRRHGGALCGDPERRRAQPLRPRTMIGPGRFGWCPRQDSNLRAPPASPCLRAARRPAAARATALERLMVDTATRAARRLEGDTPSPHRPRGAARIAASTPGPEWFHHPIQHSGTKPNRFHRPHPAPRRPHGRHRGGTTPQPQKGDDDDRREAQGHIGQALVRLSQRELRRFSSVGALLSAQMARIRARALSSTQVSPLRSAPRRSPITETPGRGSFA